MTCAQCGRQISNSGDYQYQGHQFCSQGCLDNYRRDNLPTDEEAV